MILPLAVGFVLAATSFFALVSLLGRVLYDEPTWRVVLPIALAICAISDLAFPRFRLPMARRQTPQVLVGRFHPAIGGFLWGLDTGSVISTIRASGASWAAVLLIVAGWGPWWSGLAYGIAFTLPLATIVLAQHESAGSSTERSHDPRRVRRRTLPDGARVVAHLLGVARQARLVSGAVLAAATAFAVLEVMPR